jgi:site-specific DNA-methyltransferase (adenine-specific)
MSIPLHDPKLLKTQYKSRGGALIRGEATYFLKSLKDESVDLVFADPPYNLAKERWDEFGSNQEYMFWSSWWIKEAFRVLKPNGAMYLCGFSETLADLKPLAMKYFKGCKWLVWFYRNKANLRNDWGRSHESILHLRKDDEFTFNLDQVRVPYNRHTTNYPERQQAATSQYNKYGVGRKNHQSWEPNPFGARPRDVLEIPVVGGSGSESTKHPAQKPVLLMRKIILASTHVGELVVDPFSGSGTTLVAAKQLKRKWLGCDINREYNKIAISRLEKVLDKPIEDWIKLDFSLQRRRVKFS